MARREKIMQHQSAHPASILIPHMNPPLIYKHPLIPICLELFHKPVSFAQEKIINIKPTSMKRFKIPLAFGKNHIG